MLTYAMSLHHCLVILSLYLFCINSTICWPFCFPPYHIYVLKILNIHNSFHRFLPQTAAIISIIICEPWNSNVETLSSLIPSLSNGHAAVLSCLPAASLQRRPCIPCHETERDRVQIIGIHSKLGLSWIREWHGKVKENVWHWEE